MMPAPLLHPLRFGGAVLIFVVVSLYALACKVWPKLDPDYPFGERWDYHPEGENAR